MSLEILPVEGVPEIAPGDDLVAVLAGPVASLDPRHGDVVVVTQKVVSKAEGRIVRAAGEERDEWVRRETRRVVARRGDLVIAETRHGFVCANAGVDASNVEEGWLTLLPEDPDASARRLRAGLLARLGVELGLVVTDTFGRPWRLGLVEVAIGCAGLLPLVDLRGSRDHHGRELEATVIALADEVAAASGLVMGKADRIPAAIVRGVRADAVSEGALSGARAIVRPVDDDLFRRSVLEAIAARSEEASFGPGPVPRAAIEEAVAIARPIGLLFVGVVSDAARRRVRAAARPSESGAGVLEQARALVVVFARDDGGDAETQFGAGATIERVTLALQERGLATAWGRPGAGAPAALRRELEVDEGWDPLGVIAIGRMREGAARARPPLDLSGVLRVEGP